MTPASSHLCRDLLSIGKIIADEVLRETERRGSEVLVHDPVVRENVCQRLLGKTVAQRERAANGGWVFTELLPAEEEPVDLRWVEHHAAA